MADAAPAARGRSSLKRAARILVPRPVGVIPAN
jgi:hypothetical protein